MRRDDSADREEIRDVLMRYCRGIDRRDRALIEDCFHPGATCEIADETWTPARIADVALSAPAERPFMHLLGQQLVEVEGDVAFSEAYFISYHEEVLEGVAFTRTRAGRHVDRFERRAGRWRIAHRIVVDEWSRLDRLERTVHVRRRDPLDDALARIRRQGTGQGQRAEQP